MPILWRYLLKSYLRVFFLSVSSFIAILFVSRFKEVARFAALSNNLEKTGLFIVYQFPLILPIAIPISSLIASLLLLRRLSRTSELTALCCSGFSLKKITAPALIASFALTLVSFVISAELTPFCRRESKTLLYRNTSTNPLLLLQRQKLIKLKNAYLNLKIKEEGRSAKNLTIIAHNESNDRLSLIIAEKLWMDRDKLCGKNMAVLSHKAEEKNSYDSLVLENQSFMSTQAPLLSKAVKKNRPRLNVNGLHFRHLKIEGNKGGKKGKAAVTELLRRCSLSGSPFSFTLLGCSFGIDLGRRPKKKATVSAVLLALLLLISYLASKGLKLEPPFTALLLFFPHLTIWLASWYRFKALSQGKI